jgi:DNA-binding MurR/RpiR family transcriptional regulator
MQAIASAFTLTAWEENKSIEEMVKLFAQWMRRRMIVRVIGAGRALLAGSLPGNRLRHGGADVYHLGDITPMPSSIHGGAIVACSASGKTPEVLQTMRKARKSKNTIRIVGFADVAAPEFLSLCDNFVGIHIDPRMVNPLSVFADTGEYVISLLFDSMVVRAGQRLGIEWDHEDLSPSGPYGPGIVDGVGSGQVLGPK